MRRFYGWMAFCVLLIGSVSGCGSTDGGADGNDRLVVRLVGFNGIGIEQSDSVRANSADVDVVESLCVSTTGGEEMPMVSQELFTSTLVNAVFRNDQRLDVLLDRLVVHFEDQRVGFGDLTQSINATVTGGRCSNAEDRSCAVSSDCIVGATAGTCTFSESIVPGILLVDLAAKAAVQPQIFGQGTPVRLTFSGSDVVGNQYQVTAGYTITFANFCNCAMGELCCDSAEECSLVGGQ